jgi:DNA-binding transcriptional MocR family regulator
MQENSHLVEWVRPDAGALCCVRLKTKRFDDAAIDRFNKALAKQGVRLAKGLWFGDEPRVFRLGFGFLPEAELKAALDGLAAAIRQSVH